MGKTTIGLNMASEFFKDNKKGLFISMEMSSQEIKQLFFSIHYKVRRGFEKDLSPEKQARFIKKASELNEADGELFISQPKKCVGSEIERLIRRYVQKYDINYVFVDYIQLIEGTDPKRVANRSGC